MQTIVAYNKIAYFFKWNTLCEYGIIGNFKALVVLPLIVPKETAKSDNSVLFLQITLRIQR